MWILPPIALPISLSTVTNGGVVEAVVIWSGASRPNAFIAELVGASTAIKATLIATKIAKGLALSNKGRRYGVGVGSRGACMAADPIDG